MCRGIRVDDERVLYDGHHRAVAARLMGDASIRARVVRTFEKAVYCVSRLRGALTSAPVSTPSSWWKQVKSSAEHDSQADALKHLRACTRMQCRMSGRPVRVDARASGIRR